MRKKLYIFLCLMAPCLVKGQQCYYGSAQGSINLPTFTSIYIIANNIHLEFNDWDEYINGKIYPAYINVQVKSNVPWLVKVKSNQNFLMDGGTVTSIPANIISLKSSSSSSTTPFVPLSTTEWPILMSDNNNIVSTKGIDVKYIAPWDAPGGNYSAHMTFTLTAQ